MPIASNVNQTLKSCEFREWVVDHQDELARLVAKMALGRASHVAKILSQSPTPEPKLQDAAIDEAIEKLTVKPGDDPWHRDGLVFQYISWITARIEHPNARAVLPHQITASKGLDGLLVNLAGDLTVDSIIVCEDKATDDPRGTVKDDVWPEFVRFDQGLSDSIIVSAAESVLAEVAGVEPDAVTAANDWYGERRFRVSVATSRAKMPAKGARTLFAGFDDQIGGDARRRHACLMLLEDLRAEMDVLAKKAVVHLEAWRPVPVV